MMARMSGPGSTGNVLAAIASFFIPGLGQLVQGRLLAAAVQFVLAGILWVVWLGWIVHIWSIVDAARFTPPAT
jgi:TM2 domain-containing membrane protein YozV